MPKRSLPTANGERKESLNAVYANGFLPAHLAKLYDSTLTEDTIRRCGIYTEWRTPELRRLMRGIHWIDAPALVFPNFNSRGFQMPYHVARFMPEAVAPDGKRVKYICPKDWFHFLYFPPFECLWEALDTYGSTLVIVEGILKAIAACQTGVPAIGILGPWGWVQGKRRPYEPVPTLTWWMDWSCHRVLLVPDKDARRNGGVNQGFVELGTVLSGLGVQGVRLGNVEQSLDNDGKWVKGAFDEFIKAGGPTELLRWYDVTAYRSPELTPLEEYRQQLLDKRLEALQTPQQLHSDHSPTGTGKSTADHKVLIENPDVQSLHVVPSLANCHEVAQDAARLGLDIVAYPQNTADNCQRHEEVVEVQAMGLDFSRVLCETCEYREDCRYRADIALVFEAAHAVCTLMRFNVCRDFIMRSRQLLNVHENLTEFLSPAVTAHTGFLTVKLLAEETAKQHKVDGTPHEFYRHMARIANSLHSYLNNANETRRLPLPSASLPEPRNLDRHLWNVARALDIHPNRDALVLVIALARNDIKDLYLRVDEKWKSEKERKKEAARLTLGEGEYAGAEAMGADGPHNNTPPPAVKLLRSVVGRYRVGLPQDAVIITSDATSSPTIEAAIADRPVNDITPPGQIPALHKVVQIPRDITVGTSADEAAKDLRGILYDLPQYQRCGIITHTELSERLPILIGEELASRVKRWDYFRSGESRGSNFWFKECDCLLVLGTPRVPCLAIRERLLQIGKLHAAQLTEEQACWQADYWSALTEDGKRVTMKTSHYADHLWHAMYWHLVTAELIQAVGRSRYLLPDGIPCCVLTTENLAPYEDNLNLDGERSPARIALAPFHPLSEPQWDVLRLLSDGEAYDSTSLARSLGVCTQRVREVLAELAKQGRVEKIGERGGWRRVQTL
jgi:hypothetical protein